jgi:16S rRNA processing protein RimM
MQLVVGRITRPHGVRGEVSVEVHTDEPERRFAVGSVLATDPAEAGPLAVASVRWHTGRLLVGFAGITDRTAASELTGSWLSVDSSQLPAAPGPDEFRDHELIGLAVRTCTGEAVGEVTDVLHHGQDLLVVRRPARDGAAAQDTLVPFVKAIVPEVDVAAGVLVIDPPPGLLDPAQAG